MVKKWAYGKNISADEFRKKTGNPGLNAYSRYLYHGFAYPHIRSNISRKSRTWTYPTHFQETKRKALSQTLPGKLEPDEKEFLGSPKPKSQREKYKEHIEQLKKWRKSKQYTTTPFPEWRANQGKPIEERLLENRREIEKARSKPRNTRTVNQQVHRRFLPRPRTARPTSNRNRSRGPTPRHILKKYFGVI